MAKPSAVVLDTSWTTCLGEMLNRSASPAGVNISLSERLASLAVGTAILLFIARRMILYGTLAVTGGYLLFRGVTGYCPLYADEQRRASERPGSKSVITRSTHYEQDHSARQMAPSARWPESQVG